MSNKNLENIGITKPFIAIASIILVSVIGFFIVPGNAIHDSPFINKLIAGVFAAAAAWWAIQFARDRFTLSKSERVDVFLHILILAALLILSLLVLIVWHSGPLGTTTNPI